MLSVSAFEVIFSTSALLDQDGPSKNNYWMHKNKITVIYLSFINSDFTFT